MLSRRSVNLARFKATLCICLASFTPSSEGRPVYDPEIERYSAEIVVSWNEMVLETAVAEDGLLTLKGVRTLSMMHLAVHDALNAIYPVYARYLEDRQATSAHPVAAAAQAAYEVVMDHYPEQQQRWTEALDHWLHSLENADGKTEGVALGKAVALKILANREGDNWNVEAKYTWRPMGPGVYAEFNDHSGTPVGFVFGAGWAKVKPFMLIRQNQFRSPPPPAIQGDAYVEAYDEVKELGGYKSSKRTEDQAHLAMWWKDFAENSHNRLARQLAVDEQLNLWSAARMLALLNMSICDAYIAVFENKFFYNHWRPYTAIHWAANDGNPSTVPDTTWDNLHRHTYAFPSYPSAHGTASAAAMTILEGVFGENYAFTMTTNKVDRAGPFSDKLKMDPPTRTFDSFREAAMECAMSRVYLGIHFRYDSEEGFRLGRQIGEYARNNFLNPVP